MTQPAAPPPSRLRREWVAFRRDNVGLHHLLGGLAALLAGALTLGVALLDSRSPVVLAIIAIIMQFASAALFAQASRTEPFEPEKYVGSAIAHLKMIARRAQTSEQLSQRVIEAAVPDPDDAIRILRAVNVELSYVQELAVLACDDWLRVVNGPTRSEAASTPTPIPNITSQVNDQIGPTHD